MVNLGRFGYGSSRLATPYQNYDLQSFLSLVTNFMQKILNIDYFAPEIITKESRNMIGREIILVY